LVSLIDEDVDVVLTPIVGVRIRLEDWGRWSRRAWKWRSEELRVSSLVMSWKAPQLLRTILHVAILRLEIHGFKGDADGNGIEVRKLIKL